MTEYTNYLRIKDIRTTFVSRIYELPSYQSEAQEYV